jgi:hypothetical protein
MQRVQVPYPPTVEAHAPDTEPSFVAPAYGFGLFVHHDAELGSIVSHAGGYPGFGSHMAWHPTTGLGVIGLGNLRYAPVRPVVAEALAALVRAEAAPRRRVVAMPATTAARAAVEALIGGWDDARADDLFAMNMDLDEPREARRAAVAKVVEELGPLHPDPSRPVVSASPAELDWWLRGQRGWVRVVVLVTPEPTPRVQALKITGVGDPSPALRSLAERVLALAADAAPRWPDDLPLGPDLDAAAIERALRAGGARFGAMRLGLPTAGDGRSSTTFELDTDRGRADLKVGLDSATGAVTAASLLVREREAPPEAW